MFKEEMRVNAAPLPPHYKNIYKRKSYKPNYHYHPTTLRRFEQSQLILRTTQPSTMQIKHQVSQYTSSEKNWEMR